MYVGCVSDLCICTNISADQSYMYILFYYVLKGVSLSFVYNLLMFVFVLHVRATLSLDNIKCKRSMTIMQGVFF